MRTLVPLLWMFSRGGSRSEWGVGTRNAFTEGVFLLGEHCHLVDGWIHYISLHIPAKFQRNAMLRTARARFSLSNVWLTPVTSVSTLGAA
jgi:hypothetical protein